ncbi:MAG: hypothetical protein RL497_905 [Pseudomonadota bacterium]|jgi:hypothetical protein
MQLTKLGSIAQALAGASCALLGMNAQAGAPGTWDLDAAVLFYSEDNGRVQALEPVVAATRYFADDAQLNVKLALDTLTGASPNGATPSAQPQTFTRASGKGTYTIAPNEAPLDDTFKDTRAAVNITWAAPINSDWRYSSGLVVSAEHDYFSGGLNGSITRYLNEKNTELTFGLAASSDTITPEGGKPKGLYRVPDASAANFKTQFDAARDGDDDTKSLTDVLLGVTQVINRRTIMQFNYSLSTSSGYLTDPYKLLSVINPVSGSNTIDGDGKAVYVYEQRPDSRTKHALFWQTKYMLTSGDVMDGSYRFMTDDWGVTSHTLDFKYRWQLEHAYVEPHLRYYTQSAADFYHRFLLEKDYSAELGKTTLENASADYRLGDLTGTTLGVKYARQFNQQEFSVRAEYFVQSNSGETGMGVLSQQDLYPDTQALMLTLGYSY